MIKCFRIFIFFLFFVVNGNLFSNEVFYTISVCSTTTYKDAIFCKEKVLQEQKFDISIVKINSSKYRINYGVFESLEEARSAEKNLDEEIKKHKPFIVKIDKNKPDFESFEIFSKNNNEEQKAKQVGEKIAYLTFDDGPVTATKNILEVAQEEDVPISLFFIGSQIENFRNIYENALSYSNVTIGNHTYSHANGKYKQFYSNADIVVEDVKKANIIISKDKNSKTQSSFLPTRLAGRNVFRLPIFSRNDNGLLKEQVSKEWLGYDKTFGEGFYIYGWDLEWSYESNGKPILEPIDIVNKMEYIYSKNNSRLPNKVVLLMHDRMFHNNFNGKQNLQALIKLLKNNGWRFENIERYF